MKFINRDKENPVGDTKNDDEGTAVAGDTTTAEAVADGPVNLAEPEVVERPVDPFANDTTDGKNGPAIHETYEVVDPADDRPRLEDGPRTAPPLDEIDPDTGEAGT